MLPAILHRAHSFIELSVILACWGGGEEYSRQFTIDASQKTYKAKRALQIFLSLFYPEIRYFFPLPFRLNFKGKDVCCLIRNRT